LDPAGAHLVYSILFGGSGLIGNDLTSGRAVTVNSTGAAYFAGTTSSSGLTTCPNAGATAPCASAGTPYQTVEGGRDDAFVAELTFNSSTYALSLPFSTYLGGADDDAAQGIALDSSQNIWVTGSTLSSNFPVTAGAVQPVGGGNIDAFVTSLNPTGTALHISTYLGGSGNDQGNAVEVDASGNVLVAGSTNSSDFPVCRATTPSPCPSTGLALQQNLAGGNDAFLTKLTSGASTIAYSTYVGGGADDFANGLALGVSGQAFITGSTASSTPNSFPTCPGTLCASSSGALQTAGVNGGDAFVSLVSETAPTAARVSSFAVHRQGHLLDFTWQMAVSTDVIGFDVYAGSRRLNTRTIGVHARRGYHYRASWTRLSADWSGKVYGYNLRITLKDGRTLIVPSRSRP
ncbi:MAG: SBBP repeat-containing protein, partial [Chloroflexota bacterium]|nr:SBBP repeat-containing protein [Chloroflexota bacterium]